MSAGRRRSCSVGLYVFMDFMFTESIMKKNYLCIAIGLSLASAAVHAQQPTAYEKSAVGAENKIEGVTVTARRNAESIQETPVAVSVFGAEDLRDIQASKIDGIQGAVPNLNIVQGAGSSNTVNAYIRGIGQPDALQSFDPGVGIYIDEVYYPRVQGALFSLFDVQQVEVLRGPQGTYYGKNTTGGAIKITTMNPFEDEDRKVELSIGNLGLAEARAYLSGKFSDTVAGSLSAGWLTRDGYVTDPATGKDYNDQNIKTIRGKLAFKPSDTFSAVVSLDYTTQDEALTLGQPTGGLYSYDLGYALFNDPINFNPYTQLVAPPTGDYDFKSSTSFTGNEGQELTQQGIAVTLKWDFSPAWQLHSITGYRKLDVDSYVDMDGSEYQLADIFLSIDQKQLSQELNMHYDNGRNFNAIFGVYYMDEQVPSSQVSNSDDFLKFFGDPISFVRTSEDDLDNKSMAFFATGNWAFSDGWELSAGVRYSKDSKDYSRTTSYFSDTLGNRDPDAAFSVSDDWSAWTPTASIQKAFSKNSMGYFSATRGFKSGGFNGRATVIPETYRSEYVWSYEAGLKLQSEDGFYTGRFAVFHSSYDDFQARVSEVQDPENFLPTFAFPVLNVEKTTIQGIEFEGVAKLSEHLVISGQIGWQDAQFDKFTDPRIPPGSHQHVPFSPDLTARFAVNHAFPLANGGLITVGGDASYRSETWLSVDNAPGLRQDAYTLLGLYSHWDSADGKWHIRAGVRNLTDKVYKTDAQEFSSIAGIQTAYYGLPRNYYLSFGMHF